ncbi:MAG: hypothetical protein WA231_18730 [Methylocella sp.]
MSVFRTEGPFIGFAVVIIAILVPIIAILGSLRVLREKAIKYGRHGVFLAVFIPAAGLACLQSADLGSALEIWKIFGPLLLFLGLLTLLNAPFDWASLGLTRALLRRGLELGGWWPYLLALVDAALTAVIIALLALVMVIGVQAFDELAVHGGGKPVLPLDTLFGGIAKNPAAPEYWWAYALLLSSMIPSLTNLAISGMAFTRGIPGLPRLLLLWTPEGRDRVQTAVRGRRFDAPNVFGRYLRHRGPGVSRLGPHFPCYAVDWARPARHGPRRRKIRRSATGVPALRGHPVADCFNGRSYSAVLALFAEFLARLAVQLLRVGLSRTFLGLGFLGHILGGHGGFLRLWDGGSRRGGRRCRSCGRGCLRVTKLAEAKNKGPGDH